MKKINMLIMFLSVLTLNIFPEEINNAASISRDLESLGMRIFAAGTKIPDAVITDIYGKNIMLSDFKGKVIFLNFWASWCPPCKAEMPSIQRLYDSMKNKKFTVVAVDVGEPKENGLDYFKKNKFTFPVFFDLKNSASSKFSVNSIPASYIIDKKGNLFAGMIGSFEWDDKKIIKALNSLEAMK